MKIPHKYTTTTTVGKHNSPVAGGKGCVWDNGCNDF